jgi:urea transport system substrate-binding protein
VGSDYVFPHAANAIIRDQVKTEAGVEIVGEEYIRLGSSLVGGVIQKIVKAKPDLILNTINGSTNQAFFNELRGAGIRADQVPTISFSIAENELRSFTMQDVVDDYAAWSYFMSIDRPENRTFIKKFQARYGPQRVLSDPMEAGYVAVHLWAEAARSAQTTDPEAIRQSLKGREYAAPHGTLRIDSETLHAWKPWRLGKILPSGQFEIVLSKESLIRPEPFPASRSPAQWQTFLDQLYQGWGKRWEAPQR